MNLCPSAGANRAAMPAGNQSVPAARFSLRHQRHAGGKFQFGPASYSPGGLSRVLGLAHGLAVALIIAALTGSAQGQTSVTLAWDPSPDSAIAGYRLYEGVASGTYTNVIDVRNATSATVSNLVNGVTYFFAVTAYDTNGQESDFSDEISYTVPWPTDSPPTLALTLPANGAVYTAPATINFAADVMPNGHTISQVQFYNGVMLLGAVTSAPYSFSWNNVSAGTYSLSAQVVYDSGSTVASAAVNLTVAAVRPPSGLTFVADSGTNSLPFSGTLAWDPSPDSAIAAYLVYEGVGSGAYTNVIDVGNATSATVSNLVNGITYFFAVTAYYTNGQESDFSNEVGYTNVVLAPPTIALTAPANNAAFPAPATISLAADVTANGHAITKVQFYNGTTLLGEATTSPYVFTWGSVPVGTYSLSAQVVYDSGSRVASAAVNVTVAAGRPPSGLTFVADSGTFSLPFSGTLAWDPRPDSAIAGYLVYEGVGSGAYTNVIDVGNATSATVSNLVNGVTYFFAVRAYDTNGQESDFSDEISYTATNGPPTLVLTSPAHGAVYKAPATINFAAAVMPNGHTISQVQFYNGLTVLGVSTAEPYSFSWNNVSVGTYSLSAQVVYDSGSSVASAAVNVTVATILPPSGLTFVADSGTISLLFSGTLAWDPSPDSSIAGYLLYEGVASGTFTNVIDVIDVGNATSATVSNLVNGVTFFFAIRAYDAIGQVSDFSNEIRYTATNGPPTLALTWPTNGAVYTAPATINFATSVVPNGHTIRQVQFYDGVTLLGAVISAPYSFSWNNVRAGIYSLSAQVVYDSGSTVASAAVNVTVASRKAGPGNSQPDSFSLPQQ
jgi:sulfur relay (sulfurtransferase) complex TusBCD TusD component (DsrE family)